MNIRLRENVKYDLVAYLLIIYFGIDYFQYVSKELRYLKYLFPFLVLAISLINRPKINDIFANKVYNYLKRIVILYFSIYIANFIITIFINDISVRFIANAFFAMAPLISVWLLVPYYREYNKRLYFKILFWGSAIGFILEQGPKLLFSFSKFDLTALLFDSVSETESNLYPFIFGFIFLFAVTQNYKLFYKITSLIFLFMGSKRVVLISVFILILLSIILKSKKQYLISKAQWRLEWYFLSFSLLIIIFYFLFAFGYFDSTIEKALGMSANQLTQGRQFLYYGVLSEIDITEQIFGQGLGAVDNQIAVLTSEREQGKINNLHSEILRNYIELGFILFCLWIYKKIKIICINKYSCFAMIFLFLSLASDNILIYFECIFIMYFLIIISLYDGKYFRGLPTKSK